MFQTKDANSSFKIPFISALWPAFFEGKSALTANQKEEN